VSTDSKKARIVRSHQFHQHNRDDVWWRKRRSSRLILTLPHPWRNIRFVAGGASS
jgi:hypothetical protein